ncbi:MAG: response regulator [Proteobacteria bacterium]|nr:response regulator [Pseudomonadota bacterium]
MDIETAKKQKQEDKTFFGKNGSGNAQSLHRQAEAKLLAWAELQPMVDPKNIRLLVHELRMHQLELEVQNEELRRSQEDLTASKASYMDLYDFAPVGYFTVNKAGVILEANHTAASLLRVAPGTLVKQSIFWFIFPDDQDVYYHRHKASFATDEPQTCKLRLLRTDRQPFWARLESGPVRNDKHGSQVCRMVLVDIGDGVRLAAEKNNLEIQDRQLQKAESLGRMAGAIAHNFNNILTVVMGNLDLAITKVTRVSNTYQYLESAMKAAGRAADLSGSMLTYLGQTLDQHEPLDLSEICRTSLHKLLADIPKMVDVKVDFPFSGPIIKATAHHVSQVLRNLVTNSCEAFRDEKGSLHLTITTMNLADILVTQHFPLDWQPQDNLYACLEVTDTGCGIDENDLEKIFDPFFTQKFLGRGLGLPIVLGIVRAYYGAVTVTSKVGYGTVIRVFFPVFEGEISRPQDDGIKISEISEGGTVLIVDDDPTILEIAKNALISLGFTVLVAKDGFDAVEVFRQHQQFICCVLCDVVMPGMDGWETLSALRQLVPGIAVILSSSYDQYGIMVGDHSEWPQFFLDKPYNVSELHAAIKQALANNRKRDSSTVQINN